MAAEIHSPDIYGPIDLASSPGIAGQVPISKGAGVQSAWSSELYTATDKDASQATSGGSPVLTWNTPIIASGITFASQFFALTANRLYKLEAILNITLVTLPASFAWTDDSDNPVGDFSIQPTVTAPDRITVVAWFRPLVNTNVGVENVGGTATVGLTSSIQITTIGFN